MDSQGQGREDEESSADSLCWAWKKSGSSSPGRVVNCSLQPSTRSLVNRAREAEKAGQSGSRRGRIRLDISKGLWQPSLKVEAGKGVKRWREAGMLG